jgi:hypothetical protein
MTSKINKGPNPNFCKFLNEKTLIFIVLVLGVVQAWLGRYSMQPDGVSYLDVGDSFFRRDWTNALNGWWSPLYPWTLGTVLGIVKPSAQWEFPWVQVVNFGFFVFALIAFRFLLHATLGWMRRRKSENNDDGVAESAFILLAYSIFLWVALELVTVYDVSPDMLVMAFYCLASGLLLRLSESEKTRDFLFFGLVLGLGYWAKAILFPLGVATLIASYFWRRSRFGWGRGIWLATLTFVCVCSPLVLLLSHKAAHFTFGDSGRVNYAWYVSPRTFLRNWQGEIPGSGKPVHSTRQLLQYPPLFEFDGPVVGTYPPWTDPSYWNEGLQWHFELKPQLEVLRGTVPSEMRVLISERPELLTGIISLALFSGQAWLVELCQLWPLLSVSLLGMGLYLPLVENDRYLGGYVLVLFLLLVSGVRLRPELQRSAFYVVVAVFTVMMIGTLDYTVRIATNHLAIPGVGPDSQRQEIIAAQQLGRMGLQAGDKVAVIGDGTGAYWARLGKFRIVAEIMSANHGSTQFWNAPQEVQQSVYETFARTQAKAIVSICPACPSSSPAGWEKINGTQYCIHRLN